MNEYEKLTPELIASVVGEGGYWTRRAIARKLDRKKTTYLNWVIDCGAKVGLYKKILMTDQIGEFWCYTNEDELPMMF